MRPRSLDDGRLTCVVNGPSRIVNHGLLPYLLLGLGGHSYALFTFLQYLRVRVRYCGVSLCSEHTALEVDARQILDPSENSSGK